MKLSITAPQVGALTTTGAVGDVAELAESLGFHGLWVADRLMRPIEPRQPYPASPDGVVPRQLTRVLDPITVLTFAAARTTRLRLGTSVLVTSWYSPVLLARSLASLDVLSGGRVDAGLGVGWSTVENEATNARTDDLGRRTDEFVEVLKRAWADDVVAFDGAYFRVQASEIGLKPVQRPHPPLLFAAYSAAAMRRIARVGDGWMPGGLPLAVMASRWTELQQLTEVAGRDPSAVRLIARANVGSVERRCDTARRPLFEGDIRQIAGDVRRCEDIGADEVIVDLQLTEVGESVTSYRDAIVDLAEACADVLRAPDDRLAAVG